MTGVSAVVPAYNEEASVGHIVRTLSGLDQVEEVVVVDDGSTDGTAEMARGAGARVISLPVNHGKANALHVGVSSARGQILLLVDADLRVRPRELARLLGAVTDGGADVAVAVLAAPPGSGGLGLVQSLSRMGLRWLGVGRELRAPLSGQRALKRSAWPSLNGAGGFAVEMAMTVSALRAGCCYREIHLEASHRTTGRDLRGWVHRGRQFWDIARYLLHQKARDAGRSG